jgi:sugar/nucleoside kinase (ribokinase family)
MFAGALAVLLLERRPREEAARFVVAASMIAVTQVHDRGHPGP